MPSGLNATLSTASVWPVSGAPMGWPVSASHSRTVLSSLPEAMRGAVGAERHTGHRAVWPVSGAPRGWPVSASHSRTVLSRCRRRCRCPSGLNATLNTVSVWPVSGCADGLAGVGVPQPHRVVVAAGGDAVPVGAERHTGHRVGVAGERVRRRVGRCRRPTAAPSCPRCRRRCGCPSGLNATLATAPCGRSAGSTGRRASHTRTVSSWLPETMRVPSGLNATLLTPCRCGR